MKLLQKFALLLSLLGLSVLLSLGFAAWSVQTVSQEVSSAYSDLTFVLEQLDRIKQSLEHGLAAVNRANDDATVTEFVPIAFREQIDPVLAELEEALGFSRRVGEGTSQLLITLIRNCEDRVWQYQDATVDLVESRDQSRLDQPAVAEPMAADHELRRSAQDEFEAMHALIERVQAQLLRDVEISLDYGRDLRAMLLRIILASLALSALVALLALILGRRWVLAPIEELRKATSEIASGNLAYRLEVTSSDEFGQLSGEVNHMAEMVVAAQQRLVERERLAAIGELVRRLAHNLRNPLAGIRGLAELTRDELPRDSELSENQSRIVTAVDRFEKWLSDLLRSTTPLTVRPESVPSAELCASLEAAHAPMARAKRITLLVEGGGLPETLQVDPVQMEHALVALLSNAIEATPDGGTVRFRGRVEPAGQSEFQIEMRVEDSGPGVADEAMSRIFVPHFTTKRHGTGIGLAVAHNVIASHGGQIRVERSAGLGGAAFIVTLPAGRPPGA